jgi:hypothetical protein
LTKVDDSSDNDRRDVVIAVVVVKADAVGILAAIVVMRPTAAATRIFRF